MGQSIKVSTTFNCAILGIHKVGYKDRVGGTCFRARGICCGGLRSLYKPGRMWVLCQFGSLDL